MNNHVDEILTFWFGNLAGPTDVDRGKIDLWWQGRPQDDAAIATRFGALHARALRGELDAWAAAPRLCLALIIVLDQFSRALGRGTAAAFAGDAKALALSLNAQADGHDEQLGLAERTFLYMPMMHAEDRDVARRSLAAFKRLSDDIKATAGDGFPDSYRDAVEHAEIIARFGRYPHRNALLGRPSTDAELAFLADGGPTFGQATGG